MVQKSPDLVAAERRRTACAGWAATSWQYVLHNERCLLPSYLLIRLPLVSKFDPLAEIICLLHVVLVDQIFEYV